MGSEMCIRDSHAFSEDGMLLPNLLLPLIGGFHLAIDTRPHALGINWQWSKERTFLPEFLHPDGTNTTHISRQRPQLIFGRGMVPTHLITGISVASTNRPNPWQTDCGELDAISKPCDLTCTSMQTVLKSDDHSATTRCYPHQTVC